MERGVIKFFIAIFIVMLILYLGFSNECGNTSSAVGATNEMCDCLGLPITLSHFGGSTTYCFGFCSNCKQYNDNQ